MFNELRCKLGKHVYKESEDEYNRAPMVFRCIYCSKRQLVEDRK